jgi:hypothetical protein
MMMIVYLFLKHSQNNSFRFWFKHRTRNEAKKGKISLQGLEEELAVVDANKRERDEGSDITKARERNLCL